jgi:hypothetical protein
MIQVSELRIGNWFYIGEMIGQCNADSFKDTSIFDPIPLTPEILEKCGFVFERINFYWKDPMSIVSLGGGFLYLANQRHVNIFYLHQLQNLYFALTNSELTFKP